MEKQLKVHIFCLKPAICKLIQKTFTLSNYVISCSHALKLDEISLCEIGSDLDCVIIDIDIDKNIKNIIKEKYSGIPMICIPSLNSESTEDSGIPFRLSELVKTLDEIFAEHEK
jgi:hypothetical protein